MWNLSAFMIGFKQDISIALNSRRQRTGTLWQRAFETVLLEPGAALATVAAYVDLNPLRAGLVTDPGHYRWSGLGAAVAGDRIALQGLAIVTASLGEKDNAREGVLERYRQIYQPGPGSGLTEKDLTPEAAIAAFHFRNKAPLAQLLRCRVRHFTKGAAIGSREFVETVFHHNRKRLATSRKDGARPIRVMPNQGRLFCLRDIRHQPVLKAGGKVAVGEGPATV
jgi:hypothetical protein